MTVTASGGSINDFQIKDILPIELNYSTSSVMSVPSGVTVSMPPAISGQEVVWQVNGTLLQNQTVVIELITKIVSQPEEDVKNVACVIYNGAEDCDEVIIG